MLTHKWFARPAPEVARDLIGCRLIRQINGLKTEGTIVETEAYQAGDPATHGHRRKTKRTAVMFGPAGYIYVYLIYGMYHCFNIVTGDDGELSAVLIRAVEFDTALPWHAQQSSGKIERIAAGPGKLCKALEIDRQMTESPLGKQTGIWVAQRLKRQEVQLSSNPSLIVNTTRIGISKGVEKRWRWYLKDSPAVSKR
ncbi:MAG: DNA-3-methyladenine glycosylase [Lacipirellulaceae bacterium]